MRRDQMLTQGETRTAPLRMRVTPGELNDIELLAAFDETTKSEIIRKHRMDEIRDRAAAIRRGDVATSAA